MFQNCKSISVSEKQKPTSSVSVLSVRFSAKFVFSSPKSQSSCTQAALKRRKLTRIACVGARQHHYAAPPSAQLLLRCSLVSHCRTVAPQVLAREALPLRPTQEHRRVAPSGARSWSAAEPLHHHQDSRSPLAKRRPRPCSQVPAEEACDAA